VSRIAKLIKDMTHAERVEALHLLKRYNLEPKDDTQCPRCGIKADLRRILEPSLMALGEYPRTCLECTVRYWAEGGYNSAFCLKRVVEGGRAWSRYKDLWPDAKVTNPQNWWVRIENGPASGRLWTLHMEALSVFEMQALVQPIENDLWRHIMVAHAS